MHNTNPHHTCVHKAQVHYTLSAIQTIQLKLKGETKNIIYTRAITHTHTYLPTPSVIRYTQTVGFILE